MRQPGEEIRRLNREIQRSYRVEVVALVCAWVLGLAAVATALVSLCLM